MAWKTKVVLSYPFRYTWENRAQIHLLAQEGQDHYFDRFSGIDSMGSAQAVLSDMDGQFAVVSDGGDFLFAAVDRVRSFPLFYKITPDCILVTDNMALAESRPKWNDSAARTFEKIFCTDAELTLLKDWNQLLPGEFLFGDKRTGKIFTQRYFTFSQKWPEINLQPDLVHDLYLDVFRGLADSAAGRPLIVPLSGGYDSRCIVSCLHVIGAKNVFCYTYGRKNSPERQVAGRVAKKLKLDWHFVEYSPDLLDVFYSDDWETYSGKNHHFTSLPHEQDFFALYDLRSKGILPPDGIVLPGFLGDYFAGSMLREKYTEEWFGMGHFQDWYISNRGCKFIVNAVRVYEHFGLEWRLPFAAKPILDHWFSVSLQNRCFLNGYNDTLSRTFFKPLGIDFRKPDHDFSKNEMRQKLKAILPDIVLQTVREWKADLAGQDPNNTAYLRNRLYLDLGEDLKNLKIDFNTLHARFFLKCLHEKITNLGNNT